MSVRLGKTEAELRQAIKSFSFNNRLDRLPDDAPILAEASGAVVRDVNGKEFLDFNSGQMCSALGHNHPHVVRAIEDACRTIIHASSTLYNVDEIELAEKVAAISPEPLKKSFFLSSGSDANEAAMAMAKQYTDGYEVVSPHISFHGLSETPRALSFAGWRKGRLGPFAPGARAMFAPYCYRCPLQKTYPTCGLACVDASFELFDAETTGHQAAVITEPLFSAGGVVEPPPGWLTKVQEKCRERDMLLIVDEAQTGLAKLGQTYACMEELQSPPDIVTISKHFGGGVEISGVITSPQVEERLVKRSFVFSHSHTSDPLACKAALASLEIIENENLGARALALGKYWHSHLLRLQNEFEIIGDVRGRGLIQGIELVKDRETRTPFFEGGAKLGNYCLRNGLLFSVRRNGSVLRFVPPFVTTEQQMDRAAEILAGGLRALTQGRLA